MMKGGTILIWNAGSKVKVNLSTLFIKPGGHDTEYSFSPITSKLHMQVVDNEGMNPNDFQRRGPKSRSTLALCV